MRANLIVALDVPTLSEAERLVDEIGETVHHYKVGSQLFIREGPRAVEMLKSRKKEIFLDLKFHDIPNTVAAAAGAAAALGVFMFNVHTGGGEEMMRAAVEAVARRSPRPLLIGVTVLTSQTTATLRALGLPRAAEEEVLFRARMAREAGLDGVVASPQETALIREKLGAKFVIVTPGVRPAGAAKGDQARVLTPREAVAAGANFLVVGRPILAAADPAAAARAIVSEMAD